MYISNRPSTDIYRNAGDLRQHAARRGIDQEKVQSATSQPENGPQRDATVERGRHALPEPQAGFEATSSSANQQTTPQSNNENPSGNGGQLQGRAAQLAAAYQALAGDEMGQGVRGQVVREEASFRAQQAVMSYQFHQNLTERDQITSVLGIDEYA